MDATMDRTQFESWRDRTVFDTAGEKIGDVNEVFLDQETGEPEWIGVHTGLFGMKHVLIPVAGASETSDGTITVPYEKDMIKDSPDVRVEEDYVSPEGERELYSYYGITSGAMYAEPSAEGVPADASPHVGEPSSHEMQFGGQSTEGETPTEDEASVIRSEEELKVGTETQERRLRLHKWVETEQVEVPVEVEREKVSVTTEPVDEKVGPGEIGEEELDVTLKEQIPKVETETVAKEKVTVGTETERETEMVGGEVRKERVEIDEEEKS